MVVAKTSEVQDPPTSFGSEDPKVNYMLWEWGQDENSFFPSYCKAYASSNILGLMLADLNEERSRVAGMEL